MDRRYLRLREQLTSPEGDFFFEERAMIYRKLEKSKLKWKLRSEPKEGKLRWQGARLADTGNSWWRNRNVSSCGVDGGPLGKRDIPERWCKTRKDRAAQGRFGPDTWPHETGQPSSLCFILVGYLQNSRIPTFVLLTGQIKEMPCIHTHMNYVHPRLPPVTNLQ
jgi:hypothetical protein